MPDVLAHNRFVVKEHVGLFKAANNYDILDPATGRMVLLCREDHLGPLTRLLRFTDYKRMTPFDIEIRRPDGVTMVRVRRGVTVLRSTVEVEDGAGRPLGTFRQKLLSIGGRFTVFDAAGEELCHVVGKWTSWNFRFLAGETELAHITKKWSGIGKELFTSADTYMLEISDAVPADSPVRQLIFAAVMCIDMVLKE